MNKQHLDKQAADTQFNAQSEAQKQHMDQSVIKHANKIRGNTGPNIGARTAKLATASRG